jgi:hypothetical protein
MQKIKNKIDYRVLIIFIWLIVLTILQGCDIIRKVTVKPLPPIVILEELEADYGT